MIWDCLGWKIIVFTKYVTIWGTKNMRYKEEVKHSG